MAVLLGGLYKEPDYKKLVSFVTGKERQRYKNEFASLKKIYGIRPVNTVFKGGINSYIHSRVIGKYSITSIEQLFKSMLK
jgi:hypothetical protein